MGTQQREGEVEVVGGVDLAHVIVELFATQNQFGQRRLVGTQAFGVQDEEVEQKQQLLRHREGGHQLTAHHCGGPRSGTGWLYSGRERRTGWSGGEGDELVQLAVAHRERRATETHNARQEGGSAFIARGGTREVRQRERQKMEAHGLV